MISVPTNTNSKPLPTAPTAPQIDDSYLAMAAGQMHLEGRLVQSLYGEPNTSDNKEPKPSDPPSEPPRKYFPSDGRRDKPSMMT